VRNAIRGGSRDCAIHSDFRRLLEDRNINAVTIGTPDHWHAQVAIAAMRAGKDVYCEKPMTLTIEESKLVARVARETRKIFQVGTQQRTEYAGRFRLAAELVRNGRIGRVNRITTLIGANPTNPNNRAFPVVPVPEGLDWNFWQGPTGPVDYVAERCHYDFRWWYEYSGGKMTDWGAHHNDIAQWALGMDESGPISIRGSGAAPATGANFFNCHPTFEVIYIYGNGLSGGEGTRLVCRHGPAEGWPIREPRQGRQAVADNGILFEGEDNKWIWVSRSTIQASDRTLLNEELPSGAVRLPRATNHMNNFVSCVRSRETPICHAGIGHRSVSVCHLGVIGTRFFANTTLRWDPREERFTGDNAEAANRQLSRERRAAWRLEA
jgi:myo-inositol 2-dehydrogenase / D-chiro-inositol 1-dehydrogenase